MKRRCVSLIELLIALLVLGVLAALTIPRLTRAAEAPDESAAVRWNLKLLRVAVERYAQDHKAYPGQRSDGRHPAGSPEAFAAQLTQYTDAEGRVATGRDDRFCFGPYLRDGIPGCPVAVDPGSRQVKLVAEPGLLKAQPGAAGTGWVFNLQTGQIIPNSTATDANGREYSSY